MPDKPDDGDYAVIGAGRVAYEIRIEIDDEIWQECDEDVQEGVINILSNQPVQLLPAGGRGSGIKQESKGLEFHTPTNKRLQYPGGRLNERTFSFTRYGRGYGH